MGNIVRFEFRKDPNSDSLERRRNLNKGHNEIVSSGPVVNGGYVLFGYEKSDWRNATAGDRSGIKKVKTFQDRFDKGIYLPPTEPSSSD